MRLCWCLIACLLPALHAQGFDPAEHFGAQFFKPEAGGGRVSVALRGALPPFIDLGTSGDGDFSDRLTRAETGLVIRADEKSHRTVQAAIDIGITRGGGSVEIAELDRGASAAWHLQSLAEDGADYLCEVRHSASGELALLVRVSDGGAFRQLPGLRAAPAADALPGKLEFTLGEALTVAFGGMKLSTPIKAGAGLRPAVAVSDGRARVRDLEVHGSFAAGWLADATQRQAARRALLRLRELATGGMIRGLAQQPWPAQADDLKAYTEDLARSRQQAAHSDAAGRASALAAIARALPGNGLARFEAGMALLACGSVAAAHAHLEAACKANPAPLARLALAEACRRLGRLSEAEAELAAAKKDLPGALEPDFGLVLGRVQASRGEMPGAAATLEAASRASPGHAALKEFAFSARCLVDPQNLESLEVPGPLGLRVLSDLPAKTLAALLARLEPYIEQFRYWLPGLPQKLDGTIVVFAGPVAYLNAALIAAGDSLDNVAGMFLPVCIGARATVLACRGFGEDELLRTLVHELWHLAYAAAGPAAKAPPWLNEGMAVYLSSGRMSGKVLAFDRRAPEYLASGNAGSPQLQWAERALDAAAADFYQPGNARENYAAAYAVTAQLAATDTTLLRKLVQGDKAALESVRSALPKLLEAARERLDKMGGT